MLYKITTIILCTTGFVCNSFIIFKQFFLNKTVTTYDIQTNHNLLLPSITLCGHRGFKILNQEYADLDFTRYINNTIDQNEIIDCSKDPNNYTKHFLFESFCNRTGVQRLKTTYSGYRGRCYTFEYAEKVNVIIVVPVSKEHSINWEKNFAIYNNQIITLNFRL